MTTLLPVLACGLVVGFGWYLWIRSCSIARAIGRDEVLYYVETLDHDCPICHAVGIGHLLNHCSACGGSGKEIDFIRQFLSTVPLT